jgi:predicted transcriptional regulator
MQTDTERICFLKDAVTYLCAASAVVAISAFVMWIVVEMVSGQLIAASAVTVLSGLLTPMIAVMAVYIARQQWVTARNKLKLDLFERRYVIYDAAIQLINSTLKAGRVQDRSRFMFISKTRSARFIVGQEIETYLNEELLSRIAHLQALEAERLDVDGADRVTNVRLQSEIKSWLANQYDVLMRLFADQLTLTH